MLLKKQLNDICHTGRDDDAEDGQQIDRRTDRQTDRKTERERERERERLTRSAIKWLQARHKLGKRTTTIGGPSSSAFTNCTLEPPPFLIEGLAKELQLLRQTEKINLPGCCPCVKMWFAFKEKQKTNHRDGRVVNNCFIPNTKPWLTAQQNNV